MIQSILNETLKGNFSFWILLAAVVQIALAARERKVINVKLRKEPLLGTKDVALWLGISADTVESLRNRTTTFPAIKVGRGWRYDPEDIREYIDRERRRARAETAAVENVMRESRQRRARPLREGEVWYPGVRIKPPPEPPPAAPERRQTQA